MNIADTLRGLLRRWYIVFPGIILAMAAGLGAYIVVDPGYERTASQLLLPGEGTVPPGATNPYLYLGGLTQAADIVVQVMKSEETIGEVVAEYPGTEIVVQRDPMVSGPVIQIIVTAQSDAAAEGALAAMVAQTSVVLDALQTEQKVTPDDMMSVSTIAQDTTSTPQQKTRLLMSGGAAIVIVVITLLVASLVDGLSRRGRRFGRQGAGFVAEGSADGEAAASDEEAPGGLDDWDTARATMPAANPDAPVPAEPERAFEDMPALEDLSAFDDLPEFADLAESGAYEELAEAPESERSSGPVEHESERDDSDDEAVPLKEGSRDRGAAPRGTRSRGGRSPSSRPR